MLFTCTSCSRLSQEGAGWRMLIRRRLRHLISIYCLALAAEIKVYSSWFIALKKIISLFWMNFYVSIHKALFCFEKRAVLFQNIWILKPTMFCVCFCVCFCTWPGLYSFVYFCSWHSNFMCSFKTYSTIPFVYFPGHGDGECRHCSLELSVQVSTEIQDLIYWTRGHKWSRELAK